LHGLDLIVDNGIYRWLWLPLIRRMDLVLVNSRYTGKLAEVAGLRAARVHVLNPGTEIQEVNTEEGSEFRNSKNLGDNPLLLAVGRLTRRKGLTEFVERAFPAVLRALPDTVLLVIGEDAADALRSDEGSQLSRIKAALRAAGVESAVRFLPHCDDATLSAAYRAADLHVFPVLEIPGDVEGFGMVAVEAAAHGLRTIAFNVGGVSDAVVPGITGELIPSGDYDRFVAAVLHHLRHRSAAAITRVSCMDMARCFGWDRFEERLRTLLLELIENHSSDRT
jgi:phosphatidylinositol alpha-1,6-mannosyltransferase